MADEKLEPWISDDTWEAMAAPRPPGDRGDERYPAARAIRDRRLSIVLAGIAFALLILAHAVWTTDVYEGVRATACGSALAPTRITDGCADATDSQRWWGVIVAAATLGVAYGAARLRWGPRFTKTRLDDA